MFAPGLADIGDRTDAEFLARSILEPNAAITEGFAMQVFTQHDESAVAGIVLEETGREVKVGRVGPLADGRPLSGEVLEEERLGARHSAGDSGCRSRHSSSLPLGATHRRRVGGKAHSPKSPRGKSLRVARQRNIRSDPRGEEYTSLGGNLPSYNICIVRILVR